MPSPLERVLVRSAGAALALAVWAAAGEAQQTVPPASRGLDCNGYTGVTYTYDSNIDHSQPHLDTFGGFVGLGADCRLGSSSTGRLDLEYDGLLRRYART